MATIGMVKAKGLGTGLQGGVVFHGLDSMHREMGLLTDSLRRKYIRQGIAAGGRVLIREMKQRCPKGKGSSGHSLKTATARYSNASVRKGGTNKKGDPIRLSRSIKQRPSSEWPSASAMARAGNISTAVGPTWPEGAHAHLLEFGHKLVAWGHVTGQMVKPFPFMRPAVAASRSAVLAAQESKFREGLEKESNKMNSAVGGGK